LTNTQCSKIWAAISYIPPLFLFTGFIKRKDHLAFFHAKQAIGTWTVAIFAFLAFLLPGPVFTIAKWPVCLTASAIFLFLLIWGIVQALKGYDNHLPLIGKYFDEMTIFKKVKAL